MEHKMTIGLASPSWLADRDEFAMIRGKMEEAGFAVRYGDGLFGRGWGFAATPQERAECLHSLVRDDEIDLILFGGGEGADDVLPYLDYDLFARHPKMIMSYSDGTSILNAIHFRTGLNVYYGQTPFEWRDMTDYARANFDIHILKRGEKKHIRAGEWTCLTRGCAQGVLSAGYLDNYTYLANGGWIVPEKGVDYILCLEEHSMFFGPEHVSDEIARLENSPMMKQARGILFGTYAEEKNEHFLNRLRVLGEKYGIPVAYCDDYGHGRNHAILEIGQRVRLDTVKGELEYI